MDPPIRSIARALRLLRLINTTQGLSLQDLHALSGLPKPTVFRILRTLRLEGYIEPYGAQGAFNITRKALELSSGYTEKALIVKIAAPIALATTRKSIKWPLAIGTLEHGAIVVRYSTMSYSPLAVSSSTVGHRHELLDSAMGKAYLVSCDEAEREYLALLLTSRSPQTAAEVREKLHALMANAHLGYGLRLATKKGESATLAVALRHGTDVLAVLSLTTFGRVMTASFVTRMLPILRKTAAKIETDYVTAIEKVDHPGAE